MESYTPIYPMPSRELYHKRQELAPVIERAFREFSR